MIGYPQDVTPALATPRRYATLPDQPMECLDGVGKTVDGNEWNFGLPAVLRELPFGQHPLRARRNAEVRAAIADQQRRRGGPA